MNEKLAAIFALILLGFTYSCKQKQEVSPIRQDIKELVFASGQLSWDNAYNLTAQTDGILHDMTFEVGTSVSHGELLGKIDNASNTVNTQAAREQLAIARQNLTDSAPALQQLQQNIQSAEAKYEQDKLQAERYKRLFEGQSIARVEYENMELAATNSLSQLNAYKKQYDLLLQQAEQADINSRSALKVNQITESYNNVIAPKAGKATKRLKSNGDYVRRGDIIAVIADENKIEAILHVDESTIGKVRVGQKTYIQLNTDKDTVIDGTVSDILSAFDEATQSFIVKAVFDTPPDKALDGTQLEANIFIGEKKNALLIPREYVGYGNKVNVKGKAEPITITPGIISTAYIEVIAGISDADVLLPVRP